MLGLTPPVQEPEGAQALVVACAERVPLPVTATTTAASTIKAPTAWSHRAL